MQRELQVMVVVLSLTDLQFCDPEHRKNGCQCNDPDKKDDEECPSLGTLVPSFQGSADGVKSLK